MIAHLHLSGAPWVGSVHHIWLIDFWDAEFFVLISGGLCGVLSARKLGLGQHLRRFLLRRTRLLYGYIIAVQLAFLLIVAPQDFGYRMALDIMLLSEGSTTGAILELYMWCFLLLLAISLAATEWYGVLSLSLLVYLASFFLGEQGLFGYGASTFNVGAWQLLFVIGFLFGRAEEAIGHRVRGLSRPMYFGTLLGLGALWLSFRVDPNYAPIGPVTEDWTFSMVRDHLHPLYLLKILLFSSCIYLLLASNQRNIVSSLLRWWFTIPLLQRLGSVSLQSFAFHVLLIGMYLALAQEGSEAVRLALAIALLATFLAFPHARLAILGTISSLVSKPRRPAVADRGGR